MKSPLIFACLALMATPAAAATVSVTKFDAADYKVAAGDNAVVENFESFSEGNVSDGFSTAVGTFATLGGTGSGGTVKNAGFANDGTMLAIRDANVYGRRSTTKHLSGNAQDNMFLDSNDTYGISWDVSLGGKMFTSIVLTLSDAADTGARMLIGSDFGASTWVTNLRDGYKRTVEFTFDAPTDSASIFFANYNGSGQLRSNDGFSIDDISVISEVPLPAAGFLLLGGIGGLAALKRRKKA